MFPLIYFKCPKSVSLNEGGLPLAPQMGVICKLVTAFREGCPRSVLLNEGALALLLSKVGFDPLYSRSGLSGQLSQCSDGHIRIFLDGLTDDASFLFCLR